MQVTRLSLYALAESGIFAVEFFVRLHLLIFYTDRLGVGATLASAAAGIALVWDAFIDPFVGAYSDAFQSRWGKRKPFMLLGAILIVPSLVWIFSPLPGLGAIGMFLQLAVANLLLNTGITLVTVPHAAIAAGLSADPGVRVRIFAARLIFANFGLMLGLLVPGAMLKDAQPASVAAAYATVALVIGLIALVSVVICIASLARTAEAPAERGENLLHSLKVPFQNKFFLWLFASGFLAYIAVAINSTLARFYYEHYLRLGESDFARILVVFILVWSFSAVLWVKVADRFGKDLPAALGIVGLGLMSAIAYPLFPPKGVMGPMVAAVVGGIFTGCILLFDSYVADAADLGRRQGSPGHEGLYFGIWKFGIKASRGVALALAGVLLSLIGYEAGVAPGEAVRYRIALLFGPAVGSIFVLSGIIFYFIAARKRL